MGRTRIQADSKKDKLYRRNIHRKNRATKEEYLSKREGGCKSDEVEIETLRKITSYGTWTHDGPKSGDEILSKHQETNK